MSDGAGQGETLIIRDAPPGRDVLVLFGAAVVIYVANPHDLLPSERIWITVAVLTPLVVGRLLSRAWVEATPAGIRFGKWFSRRRYNWEDVGSFALGNPSQPDAAYLLLRSGDKESVDGSTPTTVRLPRLYSVEPSELAARLEGFRRSLARG